MLAVITAASTSVTGRYHTERDSAAESESEWDGELQGGGGEHAGRTPTGGQGEGGSRQQGDV